MASNIQFKRSTTASTPPDSDSALPGEPLALLSELDKVALYVRDQSGKPVHINPPSIVLNPEQDSDQTIIAKGATSVPFAVQGVPVEGISTGAISRFDGYGFFYHLDANQDTVVMISQNPLENGTAKGQLDLYRTGTSGRVSLGDNASVFTSWLRDADEGQGALIAANTAATQVGIAINLDENQTQNIMRFSNSDGMECGGYRANASVIVPKLNASHDLDDLIREGSSVKTYHFSPTVPANAWPGAANDSFIEDMVGLNVDTVIQRGIDQLTGVTHIRTLNGGTWSTWT